MAGQGAEIHVQMGGSGPPLLMLHGYPQTHVMWHKIAPQLALRYTVILPDLRGYGDSSKPDSSPDHEPYSKRAMAADMIVLMNSLGFDRFRLVAHDRGARVAHRLALDHPKAVERLALLDIIPTLQMYEATDQALATAYFHWFLLIQPAPFPEHLIGCDPAFFLGAVRAQARCEEAFTPEAFSEYLRCFREPATIHASCEDYRAGATIDLVHDRADAGRKLEMPLLLLWGSKGVVGRLFDPLAVWSERADHVEGHSLPCGHFLAEEQPEQTLQALQRFLA
jgi:haloacetate dehalogenase